MSWEDCKEKCQLHGKLESKSKRPQWAQWKQLGNRRERSSNFQVERHTKQKNRAEGGTALRIPTDDHT